MAGRHQLTAPARRRPDSGPGVDRIGPYDRDDLDEPDDLDDLEGDPAEHGNDVLEIGPEGLAEEGVEGPSDEEEASREEEASPAEEAPDEVSGSEEVEAALDEIFRERLELGLVEEEQDEEDEEEAEESELVLLEVRPDEFVCQRCFLIKSRSQLADPVARVCRDCANS